MIAIGSDHGGFELKQEVMKHLEERGVEYKDFGCYNTDSVDYPDIARLVCDAVRNDEAEKGILICGTGIGMSIAANKFDGIRAALCGDTFSSKFTRRHNNSNVLCLGGRVTGPGLGCDIVDEFLDNEFEGGRHERRVSKVMDIEKE